MNHSVFRTCSMHLPHYVMGINPFWSHCGGWGWYSTTLPCKIHVLSAPWHQAICTWFGYPLLLLDVVAVYRNSLFCILVFYSCSKHKQMLKCYESHTNCSIAHSVGLVFGLPFKRWICIETQFLSIHLVLWHTGLVTSSVHCVTSHRYPLQPLGQFHFQERWHIHHCWCWDWC